MRISLDLSEADFAEMATGIQHLRSQFLNDSAKLIQARARGMHRFDSKTGNLERAISYSVEGDRADLYLDEAIAPYATFVHDGTGLWGPNRRAFDIKPRHSGGALFFENRFAKNVRQEGIRADPFVQEAFDDSRAALLVLFSREFDEYVGVR